MYMYTYTDMWGRTSLNLLSTQYMCVCICIDMYACTYVHTYVCGRQRAGSQMGICEDMDARDQACQHRWQPLGHGN